MTYKNGVILSRAFCVLDFSLFVPTNLSSVLSQSSSFCSHHNCPLGSSHCSPLIPIDSFEPPPPGAYSVR